MTTTRIAPGIYALTSNGTNYWVALEDGLWTVHDHTANEQWLNLFPTKRDAIAAVLSYEA